jgi:hypothetical protein
MCVCTWKHGRPRPDGAGMLCRSLTVHKVAKNRFEDLQEPVSKCPRDSQIELILGQTLPSLPVVAGFEGPAGGRTITAAAMDLPPGDRLMGDSAGSPSAETGPIEVEDFAEAPSASRPAAAGQSGAATGAVLLLPGLRNPGASPQKRLFKPGSTPGTGPLPSTTHAPSPPADCQRSASRVPTAGRDACDAVLQERASKRANASARRTWMAIATRTQRGVVAKHIWFEHTRRPSRRHGRRLDGSRCGSACPFCELVCQPRVLPMTARAVWAGASAGWAWTIEHCKPSRSDVAPQE